MVFDQVAADLFAREQRHPELLDLEAAGDIAQRGRLVVVGPAGQAQPHHGQHHIPGAGDVVHLARPRWEELGSSVGAHQRHPVAVQRDQHRFHLQAS